MLKIPGIGERLAHSIINQKILSRAEEEVLFLDKHNAKIKCNISADGDKVYHMPGDRLYNVTKIDKSKGEMYVRTETEALENGFRRSKVR